MRVNGTVSEILKSKKAHPSIIKVIHTALGGY